MSRSTRRTGLTALVLLLAAVAVLAQETAAPQPVPGAPNLLRLEGVDAESGIHYVRLLLSQPAAGDATAAPPRLTFECTEKDGNRGLGWYVSFGGITDPRYLPPFHPKAGVPYNPHLTNIDIKMTFVGYIPWKPYVRSWTLLSTGEFRYRNPGFHSPNIESTEFLLRTLNSLPGLRIAYAKPAKGDPAEVFFETRPLLDELKKTPMCGP